ncbi:MAG: CHAT domain-containing protein [Flavobacteriales bacterium]|nr:CHAT domain-containing protein [Flavobacteriales bacterium]
MMRGLLLPLAYAAAALAGGQTTEQRLTDRHARISTLYEAEKYAETVKEIDAQLKEAVGTAWEDSLRLYLYKYGRAHRKLKDASAGVAAAERIYALVKQRGNANHEVEALFDLSWTYYDVGEMKQCARVDSIAVVVADSDPKVPISQRGRARQYLAFDYSVIGDHRNSARYALAALEVYATADSIPPVQWAESYTAVGVAYWHLGRIREAEVYYMKALETLGDRTDEKSLMRKVSTNGNLGVMWQNAGDFPRAKTYYHESLRNSDRVIATSTDPFTRDESIVNRSRTYLNLATVHMQLGDDGRARELLEIAWSDRSKVLEADDPQLLTVKDRMADLEMSQGALDKAEELVSAYLTACEKKFGTRSEEYIRACSKLGEIAQRTGDLTRADSLFRVSIAAGKLNAAEKTDVVLVLTLQRRARMNTAAGKHAEAIADLEQARQVMVNIYDSSHYKVAHTDVLLAEAAFLSGDTEAALAHSRSAIGLMQARVKALKATNAPQAFPDPHILPDAIQWSVRAQRAMAGVGTVKPEWNADLDLAIASLARNKSAVQDEASKLLLIGAQKNLFDLALDLAYDAYVESGTEAALERFLALSEANRSILLKGRLNGFAGLRFAGVPDSVITEEQELVAALDLDADDRAAATDMDKRELAYAGFLKRLEQEHPAYFNLRYGETAVTIAGIRRRLLTKDRLLLAYALTGEHLYALVVGPANTKLIRLDASSLDAQVRTLNAAIQTRSTADYLVAAHALYNTVIAPIRRDIGNGELLIIPDGPLHAVNFETLIDTPSTATDFRKNLMLRHVTIAYLLSATTAVQFADLARENAMGALAIAPGFSDELKQDYLSRLDDSSRVDRDFLRYVRQPFAVRTAEGLGGTLSARLLLGGQASEQNFRSTANDYGILHLGTHAEMNVANPMYSRLVLSKDGEGVDPDADGYLHAYEIYELDLRAQLAVLTACETGTGQQDAVEGVRSLGYSFAYAGCPSMVISLWSIDEKVSSEIIARFYEHLADGLPKHKALRQAKLDHLDGAPAELALPYYWAGLVLVGDVEPVDIGSRILLWPLVLGAVLIAFFLWRRAKRA